MNRNKTKRNGTEPAAIQSNFKSKGKNFISIAHQMILMNIKSSIAIEIEIEIAITFATPHFHSIPFEPLKLITSSSFASDGYW